MDIRTSVEFAAMLVVAMMMGRAGLRGDALWKRPLAIFAAALALVFGVYALVQPGDSWPQPWDMRRFNAKNAVLRTIVVGGGLGALLWLSGAAIRRIKAPSTSCQNSRK